MPRKSLQVSDRIPYHVTNRSNNREWFYIPLESAWPIFCEVLVTAVRNYKTEIHAFVLMSNHFHLMISTPLENLNAFMRYFQTEVSRKIQRRAERINHVFGGRYKWSLLDSATAAAYAYKYVYRNPVRAGVTESVQSYAFSSLASLMALDNQVPIVDRIDPFFELIPKKLADRLEWLNRPTPKEVERLVGNALRRYNFQFSRGNDIRLQLEILRESYGVDGYPVLFRPESR